MISPCRMSRWMVAIALGGPLTLGLGGCAPEAVDGPAETHASALFGAGTLVASASLDGTTDLAGVTEILENGLPQNVLGGIGSGLTWAGGDTFLAVPDRGPNATPFPNGALDDNTSSFIARIETLALPLAPATSGPLPFALTPSLQVTTLLYSATPLIYGNTAGLPSAVPVENGAGKSYFTGRSDNFGTGLSTNPDFARLDPEAIRVSSDGNTVFIADEYGPYVYQFDRATGQRVRSFQLPDHFAINHLSPVGAVEISSNTIGRVTNKGVEGLAITPDGATLVALVQSPLLQDGGDGGRANRIVTIDVASGVTHEYVYDNKIGSKAFNSSEIIALNDHQFLIDTRDGKGLGDGSSAVVKQLWAVDIAGAQDVANLMGEAILLTKAVPKQLFLDIVSVLNANGIASTQIPAKIEGLAFGRDVVLNGVTKHTLYVGNDNDFVPDVAGPSRWFVFGFADADLSALGLSFTPQHIVERGADLALTKTASATSVVTGTNVDYTLTVANTGLLPAGQVQVTDPLPAELTLVACSAPEGCGSGGAGPTVSIPSLKGAGATSAVVTAKLSCAVADGTVVVNRASASFNQADPTPADNAATASIIATNPAPVIANLTVDTPVLWPPNNKMNTVKIDYVVTDNCDGTICSLAVSSNEGAACSDWQIVDAHTVLLRATRRGDGPGRTYLIPVTCRDSGGATSTETASVVVPHNR